MASLFTSETQSAAASGGRRGDIRRHRVPVPATALADERRHTPIQNLLYRLEAAAYAVASISVVTVAAICMIATLVVGAVMIIAAATY